MDPTGLQALADAARAHAARRLGRARLPVAVVVRLTDQLELEGVSVEIAGQSADDDGGTFSECLRDIVAALAGAGHRMTTSKVMDALDRQGTGYGEGKVKAVLSQAVKTELLTNKPDARPHAGYGLPYWS